MNDRDYSYMDIYFHRLDGARQALIDQSPDFDGSWFGEIERGVRRKVEEIYRLALTQWPDNHEYSMDCAEFVDGRDVAIAYAREHGITNEAILGLIGDVGWHEAALWITLRLNEIRDGVKLKIVAEIVDVDGEQTVRRFVEADNIANVDDDGYADY